MKFVVAIAFYLGVSQVAIADCSDINRNALGIRDRLRTATQEYKNSVAIGLRDTLKDAPPINVIADGVAAVTKMISAMDASIEHLKEAQNAGCFGKDAPQWVQAIQKMEVQRSELLEDRKTYIATLQMMVKGDEKTRR